jgi:hypothetical protein
MSISGSWFLKFDDGCYILGCHDAENVYSSKTKFFKSNSIVSIMKTLQIISALASYVEERREIINPNRYIGDTAEQIRVVELKEAIQVLDITRQVLVNECRLGQRKPNSVAKRLEISNTSGLESLPTEILRDIVDLLPLQDIKQLSCASKRLREICLPSLFRRVKFEF